MVFWLQYTLAKILKKYFRTNGSRMWRNRSKIAEWLFGTKDKLQQKQKHNRQIRKSSFVVGSVASATPYQKNWNLPTELWAVRHVTSERHWKSTLDFNETVNNHGLKRGKVCQLMIFIFVFSLKLNLQFENIFTAWPFALQVVITMIKYVNRFFVQTFGQVVSVPLI